MGLWEVERDLGEVRGRSSPLAFVRLLSSFFYRILNFWVFSEEVVENKFLRVFIGTQWK